MKSKVIFLQQYEIHKDREEWAGEFYMEMSLLSQMDIEYECLTAAADPAAMVAGLNEANMVLCWGNPLFSASLLGSLPQLKVIIRYGIGTDSIDLQAAVENGILVYNMPDSSKEELALHSLGLILASLRNIARYDRRLRAGIWDKGGGPVPRRLKSMTAGIFGLGNSGRVLAGMLRGGVETLLACDPFVGVDEAAALGVELVDFPELLARCDIISLHAPLRPETYHKFNRETFTLMKPDSMLINVSRGELIDENDLAEALICGQIGSAGLDVFEKEPLPQESQLAALDNVVLTPHSAFFGRESIEHMHQSAARLIESFFSGVLDPAHVANPAVLDGLKITKG